MSCSRSHCSIMVHTCSHRRLYWPYKCFLMSCSRSPCSPMVYLQPSKLLLATFLFMNSVHGHQCLCMREAAVGYSQWSAEPCRSCEKCLSYCAIPRLLGRVVASFLHAVEDTPSLILAVMPASMIHEFKQQCFWKFFKTEYDEANNESCW